MNPHRLIIAALGLAGIIPQVSGRVFYLDPERPEVPPGEITAVEARCAMLHARPGRNGVNGWRLVWNDSIGAGLEFDFRNYVEGDIAVATVTCGGREVTLKEHLSADGGFNSLVVEWIEGTDRAIVTGGHNELKPIMELDSLPRPTGSVRLVHTDGRPFEVAELIIQTSDNPFGPLETSYAPSELRAIPPTSPLPQGVWRYLDRENNPRTARLGGDYELAITATDTTGSYDIIYLGGARINSDRWLPAMRKGTLQATGFQNYYKLTWIDATARRARGETYATLDPAAGTLTFHFPELGASLRFARQTARVDNAAVSDSNH